MSDLIVPNIICFQTQKQLATLNSIGIVLKGVLIDFRARNFVRVKTSLLITVRAICRALKMAILILPAQLKSHVSKNVA